MPRLFAALPVPEEVSDRLLIMEEAVTGASWREREHHHVTLQFFGDVSLAEAEDLDHELGELIAPQMDIAIEGVGWFGRKEPRALYARIATNEAFSKLAKECRTIARRFGVELDSQPFKPHVTLAYCKDTPLAEAMAWSERWQTFREGPFLTDRFHLYTSFTSFKRKSRYEAVADYPLGPVQI